MTISSLKISQPQIPSSSTQREALFEQVSHEIRTQPFFKELSTDIGYLLDFARQLRAFQHVLVFGMGGATLSGQLFTHFSRSSGPSLHFVDNIDSYEWNSLLSSVNPQHTGVLVISKSGETTETLCQTLLALQVWQGCPFSQHFLFITDPGNNPLRELAEFYGIPVLDHPPGIGGRFSCFSVVGLLPALLTNFSLKALTAGAQTFLDYFLQEGPSESNAVLSGALLHQSFFQQGRNISVLFCYAHRLLPFATWYQQLWAESLGKKRPSSENSAEDVRWGSTPFVSLGTTDQHSLLQLFVEGPHDKFFTFLTLGDHPATPKMVLEGAIHPTLLALKGHSMDELMVAHQSVTIQTLLKETPSVRQIHIPVFDEDSLGQLLTFSFLEVLAVAHLWQVNPFTQPGVRSGKDKVQALMKGLE